MFIVWFLIQLRFSSRKIIHKCYGSDTVKKLRKFKKLDYKVHKNQGDLEFLKLCQENGLTPMFLNLRLTNSNLCYSNSYKQCQSLLLKEKIKSKVSILVRQKKEFDKVKSQPYNQRCKYLIVHMFGVYFWLGMTPSLAKLVMYMIRNFIIWD